MNDATTTIQELRAEVHRFNGDRDWHQFHSPKNVAASIVIEAAELLEHFQWTDGPGPDQTPRMVEELADVVIYCLVLADALDIDVSQAVRQKLVSNDVKHPAELFRGRFGDPAPE
jgi:NTP pyrophosphatase (non-canonical NTP hydrolase)